MKLRLASAVALCLAFTQIAAPAAFAQEPAQFRTVAPTAFTTEELQRYGLSAEDAAQISALQQQGYEVRVLSPEEASQYSAGISDRTWWIIVAVVVIAAVLASGN